MCSIETSEKMDGDKTSGNNALQQFILLSKSCKGLAAVELIKQVLNHQHIYVFGEILKTPSIQELSTNPQYSPYYRLLHLFAFGNYKDYQRDNYPELTSQMINKLRHLTIISLANKSKIISYDQLLEELGLDNLRELENLIIDVIYLNIIKGKMDQQNKWLEIDSTISRDIKEEQLDNIINVLSDWCNSCDNVLADIEQQIHRANGFKSDHIKNKQDLDNQIASIEKSIKNSNQELDYTLDGVNLASNLSTQRESTHSMKSKRSIQRLGRKAPSSNI